MTTSSSSVAAGSRSSSPATPESSDCLDSIPINSGIVDINLWYYPAKSMLGHYPPCDPDSAPSLNPPLKTEQQMLRLNDLIEEHAYDDSQPFALQPSVCTPQTPPMNDIKTPIPIITAARHLSQLNVGLSHSFFSSTNSAPLTKPIPPPPCRSRKHDPSLVPQKTIYPPRESCHNLSILTPSIPKDGTKSRVETQVRVTVDLADTSASDGDPNKYDRVGSWNWLKLPPGTATKRRTRKQGKIDPAPEDTLHLTASVTCASPPHNQVLSCSSCRAREAKRVARKLAARVRPIRSDSDSPDDLSSQARPHKFKGEDTTSIVQFNCSEVQDLSSGSVVLPLRITCYCRHHREKVGFHVHMTMIDHTGRVVATGTTRPIMITDDHKSTGVNKQAASISNGFGHGSLDQDDWPQTKSMVEIADQGAPSKRKNLASKEVNGKTKKRPKPYDNSRVSSRKPSREASVTLYTPPSTPPQYFGGAESQLSLPTSDLDPSALVCADAAVASPDAFNVTDVLISGPPALESPTSPSQLVTSPTLQHPAASQTTPQPLIQLPYLFFDPALPTAPPNLPLPKIRRLIPSTGPTFGGIEVTVLGANFHPSLPLQCVFGDTMATSTHRWSDNTLVCMLPPRPTPGVVSVWFDGFEKDETCSLSLFTYSDESDRALMELALQVVGLKMTGKIEDARNVAMRIVGSTESGSVVDAGGMLHVPSPSASAVSTRDVRQLLLLRGSDNQDFESLIVDFLGILDVDPPENVASSTPISTAISHTTPSGQTLLHLAAFLGFVTLVKFLLEHGIDMDARDRNGCTALHFAALGGSKNCARALVDAGADLGVVNGRGKRPDEIVRSDMFDFESEELVSDGLSAKEEDEEAEWGDAEEDSEDEVIRIPRRTARRGLRRKDNSSASIADMVANVAAKPTDVPSERSEKSPVPGKVDEKQVAWYVDMIQRTLAQLHAPQGIIPAIPNMPALPQIPVFPVFVPIPFFGSLLGERKGEATADAETQTSALRAAMDKWMAAAGRPGVQQQQAPPPMYTPRADEADSEGECAAHSRVVAERLARRPSYASNMPVTDQEVKSFAYRPTSAQVRPMQKKHDRMLLLFWLPILFLSLLYALYNGIQALFHVLRASIPFRGGIRA